MKINTIINRYIFKEMLPPFILCLLVFSFIFLMARMIKITNWIVNYDVSILSVGLMICYSMPLFLVFVLPMSVMMSILLTFLRMSGDNEITALKTGGFSIYRFLPPVVFFFLAGFAATLFITIYAMPWASLAIKELTYSVAATNADIGLKERTFNDSFKDVMLYVNKVDIVNKELIDVFIEDKRQPDMVSTVIAPRGKLFSEPDKYVFYLLLYDGTIYQTNVDDRIATSIRFDSNKFKFDLQNAFADQKEKQKDRSEMSVSELIRYAQTRETKDKHYYKALIEMHQRFSLPFTCIALGILAMPLGLQSRAFRRSYGLILGLFFFLVYYLLLSAGSVLGKTGSVPPAIGIWVPNAVMGGIGIYLLLRSAREKQVQLFYAAAFLLPLLTKFRRKRMISHRNRQIT